MASQEEDRDQIKAVIGEINAAWIEHREDDLNACFHEEAVVRTLPGFQRVGDGRESCVQSYRDFNQQAVVKGFNSSEPEIDLQGDSAIAGFEWEIRYELKGNPYHERGFDLFALRRGQNGWLAVWRGVHFSPAPEGETTG